MQNKQKLGLLAEQLVAYEAIKRGFNVSIPTYPASKYDMILDHNGTLNKVQIKTTSVLTSENRLNFKITGFSNTKYKTSEVDIYILVTPSNELYIVPNKFIKAKSLRLYPSKKGKVEKFKDRWDLLK